jgi:uncharacterized membrane protein YfhO
MQGWTAAVDGRARPIREYDGVFQAVTLGAGSHRVTFAYTPPHMGWAFLAFASGCLWLLVAPVLARSQTRTSA